MYFPQLDTFRFIAVLFVLLSHWFHSDATIAFLDMGMVGVDFFFVLSGFLISLKLLETKEKCEDGTISGMKGYGRFILKRAVRLLPAYYVILFLATAFNPGEIRDSFAWNAAHVSNFYQIEKDYWTGVTHFWSLSVEEHVYLLHPIPLIFLRRTTLPVVFIALICASMWFRLDSISSGQIMVAHIHTISCVELFCYGGLLAWIYAYRKAMFNALFKRYFAFVLVLAILLMVVHVEQTLIDYSLFKWGGGRSLSAIVFVFLIGRGVVGYRGLSGRIFSNPMLVWAGKISYGMYLTHNFVPGLLLPIEKFDLPGWVHFVIYFVFTVLISYLLYRLVERPLIRWFRRKMELKNG